MKGVPDGTEVQIQIFEHDEGSAHDLITQFSALVEKQKVEAEWEYEYHEDTDDIPSEEEVEKGYRPPEYFFRVEVEGIMAESGLLTFKDWIELVLTAPSGAPFANEPYRITFADGSKRDGQLDGSGKARIENVPPGPVHVSYPERETV